MCRIVLCLVDSVLPPSTRPHPTSFWRTSYPNTVPNPYDPRTVLPRSDSSPGSRKDLHLRRGRGRGRAEKGEGYDRGLPRDCGSEVDPIRVSTLDTWTPGLGKDRGTSGPTPIRGPVSSSGDLTVLSSQVTRLCTSQYRPPHP